MSDKITFKDIEEQLKRAQEDPSLPPWVGLLLSMVWVMLKGLHDQLESTLEKLLVVTEERDLLKRKLYGSKRERTASGKPKSEGKKPPKVRDSDRPRLETTELPEEIQEHASPTTCPKCGGHELKDLKAPEEHIEYVMRPASLVRVRHRLQKCACLNGCTVTTAPAPLRVGEGGTMFGPSVYANIIASRAFDALPFSRQADRWSRAGIPLRKTTIFDLFHRGNAELKPLYEELLREVSQAPLIHADETPQPFTAEGKTRRGYFWVFAHERFSAYVFSKTRSGDVPHVYLKDTEGHIVVDGYTGYNSVTTPKGRKRVGCLAHMRRKFYEALVSDETVAPQILSLIKEVYAVEGKIKTQGQQGTEAHLTARQKESKPFMNQLKALIDEHRPRTPPKSMLAKALTYAHNQWSTLILFLNDLTIPLDNNHAERLLRRIALARKTSLFIKPDLGESYAIAYSLVQSCRLCGVNPEIYLADVLLKVQTTPQQQLRSLLPDRWKPPDGSSAVGWV